MRALILLLSALVVGLAASIIVYMDRRPGRVHVGEKFEIRRLLIDSQKGEQAVYRDSATGRLMTWRVNDIRALGSQVEPTRRLYRKLADPMGQALSGPGATAVYWHKVSEHGWFPLTAPHMPQELDRVWIVRGISRETIRWHQKELKCWRVDFIDPALPEHQDTVVGWFHRDAPVFGLIQWKRLDATWVLQESSTS